MWNVGLLRKRKNDVKTHLETITVVRLKGVYVVVVGKRSEDDKFWSPIDTEQQQA